MELKENILKAVIAVFREKGIKFTMNDIASQLGISKKTIYTVFPNKEELLYEMVDYVFDAIKESERAVVEDDSLTLMEKIRAILLVLPEGYREIDFRQLYLIKERYPRIYKKLEYRLETGWEMTIALLEQGIEAGVIRTGCCRSDSYSHFQDDAGGIAGTVFPERYSGYESHFFHRGTG